MPPALETLGFVAGLFTTCCWLPQATKIIASRDTRAISITTQLAFTLGCSLWTAYGALIGSPSIIIFNALTASLAAAITILKVKYG